MDVHCKGKSYRPTEDEAKGHQERKREKGINYSGLQAADQGCRHYCFRMSQMKFR